MNPLFSVVIPTLNEANFLPTLLADLANQKEKDLEVIIVDSFSKDNTQARVREFNKKLKIRFYKVKSRVSKGRNYGAYKAKGDFVIFLDADAQIEPDFTRILKQAIQTTPALIYIPAILPDKGNFQTRIAFTLANYFVEFSQNLTRPFSTGGSMVVERNLFARIGGFDEKLFLSEDHNLIQRAQYWGVKARFLHDLKLKFSMRRMRNEGAFSLFYKYSVATLYVLFKGDMYDEIFSYPMGGALYDKKESPKKN